MTEAQWGALTKMAQYMPPFDTNDLRRIYLTISADGIVYMYVKGEVDSTFRLDDDIPYDVIMVYRDMWNRWWNINNTHND